MIKTVVEKSTKNTKQIEILETKDQYLYVRNGTDYNWISIVDYNNLYEDVVNENEVDSIQLLKG